MKKALWEAKKAFIKEEIPVGAIIVNNGKIVSRGYNQKEMNNNPIAHAEIMAIQKACKKLKTWRLNGCEMYVTLEPCAMCAGAIIQSRISKIYIGTLDSKTGAAGSVFNLFKDYKFNHNVEIEYNILQKECEEIIKNFFKKLRR